MRHALNLGHTFAHGIESASGFRVPHGEAVAAGVIPMLQLRETLPAAAAAATARPRFEWWRLRGVLVPSLALAALGTVFSMYDVVWPQYLSTRGYGPLVIGISISLFAIPILALARTGGRLADRFERRWLVGPALLTVATTAATYPFFRNLAVILVVGTVEAIAVVVIEPSLFAVIGDTAPEDARGRAMGVGGMFEASGLTLGAAALGSLYGITEGLPFWGGSATLVAAAVLCMAALPSRPALPVATQLAPEMFPVREKEVV